MNNHFFGLDYGSSFSSIAYYKNSNITLAPNRIGERITPSLVSFSENSKDIFIGEDVLDQKLEGNTLIYDVKRFVGLNYDQFKNKNFSKKLNYTVVNDRGIPKIKVKYNGREELYTAGEISSFIIKKIVKNTEDFIHTSIKKAVMAVPVHFSKGQIDGLREAAKEAGIEITRVIKEPTAAALAYGIGEDLNPDDQPSYIFSSVSSSIGVAPIVNERIKVEENAMVFDLGGGTFDVTLLNIRKVKNNQLNFDIKASNGIQEFGGSDFDDKLVDYCINKFCQKTKKNEEFVRNNKKAFKRLKVKCENAKKLLSVYNEAIIKMDNFNSEVEILIKITVSKFEDICSDLFEKIKFKIKEMFSESPIKAKEVDSIILIGGGTRMPGIKKLLKEIFGDENKIKDSINPEEAVAIGAALEAAKIEENSKINFTLQDIIPYNLGVSIANQNIDEINKGEKMYTMIRKNSRIPSSSEEKPFDVYLSKEKPDITFNIYEGNKCYVSENFKLGCIRIDNIKKIGKFECKIQFHVDVNSRLKVSLKVESLGISKTEEIQKDVTHGFLDKQKKTISIFKSEGISTIGSILEDINFYKSKINSFIGAERNENLIDCSNKYEELINSYMKFSNNNDFVFEKIYLYTKELFEIYIDLINSNQNSKDEINEIITKIKGFMKNLIFFIGYVTCLIDLLSTLNKEHKKEFYQILINYFELMIEEGNNRLKKVQYKRYYSKLYFEKAFFVYKRFITDEELCVIDRGLAKKLKDELYPKIKNNLIQINSFVIPINSLAEGKQLLYGSSGFTMMIKEMKKTEKLGSLSEEELEDLIDLFQSMADTFNFKEKNIGQAFCLANIIKINWAIIKNRNLFKLKQYIEKIEMIMSNKKDKEYEWYNEIKNIIKEIKKDFNN